MHAKTSWLPATPTTGHQGAGHHVLLVEDLPSNRRLIEVALTRQGFAYSWAENGLLAVERVTREDASLPDLILMDCQMPVMDGLEATRRIRAWEKSRGRRRLPIIALTADAYEEHRQKCLAVGMDEFLAKPVHLNEMLATILKVLAASASSAAAGPLAAPPSDPPSPSALLRLDIAGALERLEGDRELLRTLIGMLPAQIAREGAEIPAALASLDMLRLRKAAHRIKGSFSVVGADRAAHACARLEAAAKAADPSSAATPASLAPLWRELESAIQDLTPALDTCLRASAGSPDA